MRKWRSGSASPCQGEGRGFESRLPLGEAFYTGSPRWSGREARQRPAKPCTRVQIPSPPRWWLQGRLAQRERASLTRKRSLVRSQYRPRVAGAVCPRKARTAAPRLVCSGGRAPGSPASRLVADVPHHGWLRTSRITVGCGRPASRLVAGASCHGWLRASRVVAGCGRLVWWLVAGVLRTLVCQPRHGRPDVRCVVDDSIRWWSGPEFGGVQPRAGVEARSQVSG